MKSSPDILSLEQLTEILANPAYVHLYHHDAIVNTILTFQQDAARLRSALEPFRTRLVDTGRKRELWQEEQQVLIASEEHDAHLIRGTSP